MNCDNDIRNMGLEEMRRERVLLLSELKSIESQISNLAFNNYGTYADAGRATHDCSKTFGEMRDKTTDLSSQAEELAITFQEFRAKAKVLASEQELVKKALDKSNPIWELLCLPSRMDVCIRAGYYDLAYSLTNYGMQLQQQSQLTKNPLIKKVADKLVESRSYLLEELFNKFTGPLDLAESIKVVNNVRKMPYLTANQLRISVLQHRDIYLDKQILDISGNSDMIIHAIEIYRTCMYDTLVLYLAVFPENETIRKDPSADPRWESWPTYPPSSLLSQWAISNIKRLLELIQRAEMKSAIDLSTVWSKLMTMGSSFGRMGIDFRPLIAARLTCLIENRFKRNVQEVTNKLTGSSREIVMIGIDPASLPQFETAPDAPPVPPAELSLWDDLTIYANAVVDALNGVRFLLSPAMLSTVVSSLRDSIRNILSWLSTSHSNSANFSRAIQIITTCLAPFFEKCVMFFFPPTVVIKLFGSAISKQKYIQFLEFDMRQLAASCDGAEKIEEHVLPLIKKKTLADINLDAILKPKEDEDKEEQHQASFFIDEETDSAEEKLCIENAEQVEQRKEEPESQNSITTEGLAKNAIEERTNSELNQVAEKNVELEVVHEKSIVETNELTDWDEDGWGKEDSEEEEVKTENEQAESTIRNENENTESNENGTVMTNNTQSSAEQNTDTQTDNTQDDWEDHQKDWGWEKEEEIATKNGKND